MHDKMKTWSEGHGSYADMTQDVGSFTDDEGVAAMIVKRGVVPMANCSNCGRQWKGIVPWGEIAQMYIGAQVANTKPVREGILCALRCPGGGCGKTFSMIIAWPELENWVNAGVSSGVLRPEIKQARGRGR